MAPDACGAWDSAPSDAPAGLEDAAPFPLPAGQAEADALLEAVVTPGGAISPVGAPSGCSVDWSAMASARNTSVRLLAQPRRTQTYKIKSNFVLHAARQNRQAAMTEYHLEGAAVRRDATKQPKEERGGGQATHMLGMMTGATHVARPKRPSQFRIKETEGGHDGPRPAAPSDSDRFKAQPPARQAI